MKRTLTAKLKEQLKKNYANEEITSYSGDALTYLKRVKALDKARAAKKVSDRQALHVGDHVVRKGTDAYDIIEASAKTKGLTAKKFIKQYKDITIRLIEQMETFQSKEADYIIEDAKRAHGHYINGKRVSKARFQKDITDFKSNVVDCGEVYNVINIEYSFDLLGNIKIDLPTAEEMDELECDPDEWQDFLSDNYPHVSYIPNSKEQIEEKKKAARRDKKNSPAKKSSKPKPRGKKTVNKPAKKKKR
jgi:hypothetical protein